MADGEVIIDDAGGDRGQLSPRGSITVLREEPSSRRQHMEELTNGGAHQIPGAFIKTVQVDTVDSIGTVTPYIRPVAASRVAVFGLKEQLVTDGSTTLSVAPSKPLVEEGSPPFKYDTPNSSLIINVQIDGKNNLVPGADKAIVTLS